MEIRRDKYLSQLEGMMHTNFVKIVTGIRRCGKSYLLFNLFNDLLLARGVERNHIVKIDLDSYSHRDLRNPEALYGYLDACVKDEMMHYIMLDEIQLVTNFAEILNEFLRRRNVDLYVTGSNARLLSKDVITEFRGRGHEIRMYPLSFGEFMSAYDGSVQGGLNHYMTYGGLPQLFEYVTDEQKAQFLKNLFAETYLRDIKERYDVRKADDLDDLINLIASNVGCLTNPKRISDTFKSMKQSEIGSETVARYIEYLEDAFIVEKACRYDVKGRKYIGSPSKYYFGDLGLRNARLNFRQFEKTHLMENVIYNELRCRGYNVDVGVVPTRRTTGDGVQQRSQLEIDFVCNLGSKRYYVQSAYSLPTEEKEKQEVASLVNVGDSFKKFVVTGDEIVTRRDEAGITTINIYDFLLNPNSLEL